MEIALLKYFAFMISSVLSIGILMLWLKANKIKRQEKQKKEEALEIQKQLYKQAKEEKEKLDNQKKQNFI
jgi:hypothetical protein